MRVSAHRVDGDRKLSRGFAERVVVSELGHDPDFGVGQWCCAFPAWPPACLGVRVEMSGDQRSEVLGGGIATRPRYHVVKKLRCSVQHGLDEPGALRGVKCIS